MIETPMPIVAIPPSVRAARYRSNGITVAAPANRAAPSTAYPDQEKGTNAAVTVHMAARIHMAQDETTTRGASDGNRRSLAALSKMPPAAAMTAAPPQPTAVDIHPTPVPPANPIST